MLQNFERFTRRGSATLMVFSNIYKRVGAGSLLNDFRRVCFALCGDVECSTAQVGLRSMDDWAALPGLHRASSIVRDATPPRTI